MRRECKNCGENELPIYANKLCQRCLSLKLELDLISKNKKLLVSANELIDEYLIQRKSVNTIATERNTSKYKIKKNLERLRIPIRDPKHANSKFIDEDIFDLDTMTAQGAFLLGYVFTDGDLLFNKNTKKYFMRIYSKDLDQIKKIKTILKAEAKIQHRAQKNYGNVIQGEIYFLHIGNQRIIGDLLDFGLVLKKNQEVKFPKLPKKFIHHFIRGCWAGSGNVTIYKEKIFSSIIIGSYEFMIELEKTLNKWGLKKRNIYKNKQSKKPSYLIKYAHTESENLYNLLYKGSSQLTVSLKQHNIYKEYFIRK